MKNKIFDKIASLFRKSEIEKQVKKSRRPEAIPEQEHARHKGIGSIKERLSAIFTKRKRAEEFKKPEPFPQSQRPLRAKVPDEELPVQVDVVITNVREQISMYAPAPDNRSYDTKHRYEDILNRMMDDAIEEFNERSVARRLSKNAYEVNTIIVTVFYDSDQERVNMALVRFATILNGAGLDKYQSEEITDIVDMYDYYDSEGYFSDSGSLKKHTGYED